MNIVVLNTMTRPATAPQAGFWARVWTAITVSAERRELAELDDHMLRDIGLTREQAEHEAARPIWDLSTHR